MKVIKRDGSTVDFDRAKIVVAIQKANQAVEEQYRIDEASIDAIADAVASKGRQRLLVEDIQDMVETKLMAAGKYELAKAYIIYRYTRALVRKANTTDESILALIRNDNKDLAEENSNKNTAIASTQRDYIAGEVSRDLTRRILLPEKISKAHDEGVLHFHDADYFVQHIFNCCLVNIGDMLDNGTMINGKLIESPKSFQVACTIVTQIIACVASNQYGGQSVEMSHLGKYLRLTYHKYLRKTREAAPELDDATVEKIARARTKDELKSGVQTIQYQINTLMTTNGQSPFVTLFLAPPGRRPLHRGERRHHSGGAGAAAGGHQEREGRLYHPRLPQAGVRAGRAQLPEGRQVRLPHGVGRQVLRQADVPRLHLRQEDAGELRGQRVLPHGLPLLPVPVEGRERQLQVRGPVQSGRGVHQPAPDRHHCRAG